jgi:Asp-tRNA(Asn)/Glu-tRNA(Gln) amidotransferase A subunit family amidase
MLGVVDALTPAVDIAAAIRSKQVSPVEVHQSGAGLPVGVQLVTGPWREDLLLQLGTQLEQALPRKDRHPALAG